MLYEMAVHHLLFIHLHQGVLDLASIFTNFSLFHCLLLAENICTELLMSYIVACYWAHLLFSLLY